MAGRFSVEAIFRAVDRVTAPVARMQTRVQRFTRSMTRGLRSANRAMGRVAGGLKTAGRNAAVAGAIFIAASANVLAAGAEFEQAITNVGAVSLQTRAEIAPLEKMALDLGRTTKFTSTQAANAMEVMTRAGFSMQEVMAATPAVLSAAAASGMEIAEVADHVSNALKGMGLESNQAARVADVLTLASARTNSSIGSLGESLRNVASTARQLGVPLEEAVASVALLQDVGLDASVAGSAFNTMLTKMAAPTDGIRKQMDAMGISFKDAEGDMLPLSEVLGQLNKASAQVGGNFDKVAFLAELVGLRGQKAAANLGTLFESGKLTSLTAELENAAGSADKMANLRMDTVNGSLLLLGSAVDAVKVKIFGLNSGPLKDVVDQITNWVGVNEDLIATNVGGFLSDLIENLDTIILVVKRVAIGIAIFIALSVVLKSLVLIITAVNLVLALNPFVLIALAIIALIAVVAGLIAYFVDFEKLGKTLTAAWSAVGDFFSDLWGGITDTFQRAWDFISGIVGKITAAVNVVKNAASKVSDFGSGAVDSATGAVRNAASGVAGFFGFGDDEATPQQAGGQSAAVVQSPQERVARSIEERRQTSSAEVTIRDESGRAEVTKGSMGAGVMLQRTGAL